MHGGHEYPGHDSNRHTAASHCCLFHHLHVFSEEAGDDGGLPMASEDDLNAF